MPVDPDISQSTAGGGYQPGFDTDYNPDRPLPRPKMDAVSKPKQAQEKEQPFSPSRNTPFAYPGQNAGAGSADNTYRRKVEKESRAQDVKRENKNQQARKISGKDNSARDGGSNRAGGGQKALEQAGQSKGFTNNLPGAVGSHAPGAGGSKPGIPGAAGAGAAAGGAKGAKGGGKAAAAEAAMQGAQKGLEKIKQGDFKGGVEDAAIGAIEGVGSAAASKLFFTLAEPHVILVTLTLSIFVGWNVLLIAPKLLKGIVKTFTDKEIDIKLETWQRAVIIAMDAIILFVITLAIVTSVAAFCYGMTSSSVKDRLIGAVLNPAAAGIGEVGRFVLPAEFADFCGRLTGNGTSQLGSVNGGGGSGGGSGGGAGGPRCQPARLPSPAAPDNLANSCFGRYGPEVVRQASIVAQAESNGNPSLPVGQYSCGLGKPTARCEGGEIPVWGLYQINLIVHQVAGLDCPSAFRNTSGGRHDGSFCRNGNRCVVVDQGLYNRCVQAAINATNNINTACRIYQNNLDNGRPGWWDWGNVRNEHANRCGF